MLAAVVRDVERLPGIEPVTICRRGVEFAAAGEIHWAVSPDDCMQSLRELVHHAEAALIIAPETDGILERCTRSVEGSSARLLGPDSQAVALCADKLSLCRRLQERDVPTIETHSLGGNVPVLGGFPLVIKPRDGAGSQETYLVRNADELHALQVSRPPLGDNGIWQPFVAGQALSVAVLVDPDSNAHQPLLPCEQTLSQDGRFRYLGGIVPARDAPIERLQRVAVAACKSVPGLRGYVGVDLVLPDANPDQPLVVEINPRLTTSYLGYSALAEENLGQRLLHPDPNAPIRWRDAQIRFESHG